MTEMSTRDQRLRALKQRYGETAIEQAERLHGEDFPAVVAWADEIDPHYAKLWLDFTYAGHRFTIHNPLGYWLFVADPACPEPILSAVASHFLLINPE